MLMPTRKSKQLPALKALIICFTFGINMCFLHAILYGQQLGGQFGNNDKYS